jgi:hypothetical protein
MSKNSIKGSQSALAAESIRLLDLKDKNSVVDLLCYAGLGYISVRRAAEEIMTKHRESLPVFIDHNGNVWHWSVENHWWWVPEEASNEGLNRWEGEGGK